MAAFDLDRIGGAAGLRDLTDCVLEAGERALAMHRGGAADRATRKADRSPVTEADEAVEKLVRGFLEERYPEAGFLGEETGEAATQSGIRFIVDPIDGTRAFLRGFDTWSILVGVEADGEPVACVALMPAAGDLFVGVQGDGAFMNGRRCRVSETDRLEDAVISHGGLHQFTDVGRGDLLVRLGERTFTQRGLTDFDGYRQLLLGKIDAMVDPGVKPWDICPAAVLIREAGGRFTDFSGEDTIYAGNALSTNGRLHDAMLTVVDS